MTSTEPRTTNDLPARVLETAKRHHLEGYLLSARLIVGVSGGTDSLALLHILRELRGEGAPNSIHVAHLDHGLRGDQGRQDAEFVRRTAEKWGLPCTARSFDVKSFALDLKLSVEEAARKVRYAFLAELARQRTATVAVAHNADDQAETVLMNMLRGTGVTGLAGMRMLAPGPVVPEAMEDEDHGVVVRHEESSIMVFRPLLDTWRWEIEDYCDQVGLVPREDATNTSPAYERNRVRHELIPRLERYYSPAVKEHLVNLAVLASEAYQFR